MLRNIVEYSLKFRLLVASIVAVLVFLGFQNVHKISLDVVPEFSPPYVEVQTEALGLSAEEVEQLITVPLEADLLNGVAWLKTIHSSSIPGLSSIVLIFEAGTDIVKARQMVQERLTLAHGIPQVSKPPVMLQPLSSTSRVMQIGMTSQDLEKVSHIDMSVLARWTIQPRLMGVPGVAHVSIWGQRKRQLQVLVDPEVLRDKGVTLDNVIKTTGESLWVSPLSFLKASTPGTGGWIDTPNQRLGVRHVSPINSPEQLARVPLHGKSVPLRDVADVVENHQLLIGDSIVNDGPGLLLVVEKFPWANTLDVTRGVEKALEGLKHGLTGIDVNSTVFRPATFIEDARDNVLQMLVVGFLLLAVALFAVLPGWQSAATNLIVIAVCAALVLLIYYWQGITINALAFCGLAVALVALIHDVVMDMFAATDQTESQDAATNDQSAIRNTVVNRSIGTRTSMIYATLIIAVAVVPVLFMTDLLGAFLKPMALAFLLAIAVSCVVALACTPILSSVIVAPGANTGIERTSSSPIIGWLNDRHRKAQALLKGSAATIATAAIFAVGLLSWLMLDYSLLPKFKDNTLLVKLEGTPSTSRLAMNRIVTKVSQELRALPSVENVSAHVGRAVMSDEIVNVNSSQLWVSLKKDIDYDTAIGSIGSVISGYPGLDGDVLTYVQAKLEVSRPEADEDLAIRVYGSNTKLLEEKAEEIRKALADINGIKEADVDRPLREPTVEIKVDLERAKNFGIKPGDVRRAATTLLSGIEVGSLFEEQKVFDVVVWAKPEVRQNVSDIKNLMIDTPHGGFVRLSEVADVNIAPAQTVIKREAVSRHIDIDAAVEGRSLSSVLTDVEEKLKTIDFPLEHHAAILGEHAERRASLRQVRQYAIAALIAIFLLLQAAFGSWMLALVVFLTLPVALSGGLIANLLTGGVFSLGSIAGLLATFALSTRISVASIRHVQETSAGRHDKDAIAARFQDHFPAIVSTLIASACVLVPFAFFAVFMQSGAGLEIMQPAAIVALGGLITTAFVNLYILPNFAGAVWPNETDEHLSVGQLQ